MNNVTNLDIRQAIQEVINNNYSESSIGNLKISFQNTKLSELDLSKPPVNPSGDSFLYINDKVAVMIGKVISETNKSKSDKNKIKSINLSHQWITKSESIKSLVQNTGIESLNLSSITDSSPAPPQK